MASVDSGQGSVVARRYARAAFELAQVHGDSKAWVTALEQTAEFMSDPEVQRVLGNTRVEAEAKQRLITAALGDQPVLALNMARLLVRKNRTNLAADISEQFKQLVDDSAGIERARATTAVPLSDGDRQRLIERLREQTGHEIILETAVDPALLGGVVVQIGDWLVDASTRARLQALRDSLSGAV
jgi:F-type H+-transporting ATPase subunit delta